MPASGRPSHTPVRQFHLSANLPRTGTSEIIERLFRGFQFLRLRSERVIALSIVFVA